MGPFARLLDFYLKDRTMTVGQLAKLSGVNRVALYRMLAGTEGYQHPLARTLAKLSLALRLDPQERVALHHAAGRPLIDEASTATPSPEAPAKDFSKTAYILVQAQPKSEALAKALDGTAGTEAHSVWGEVDLVVRVRGHTDAELYASVDRLHSEPLVSDVLSTSTLLVRGDLDAGEVGDPDARVGSKGAYVLIAAHHAKTSQLLQAVREAEQEVAAGRPAGRAPLKVVHAAVVMGAYDMVVALSCKSQSTLWGFVMASLQQKIRSLGSSGGERPRVARTTTLLVAAH